MLKSIFILLLISLAALPFGFITSSFHVLQRPNYALAPQPYTEAPCPLFPILYKYISIDNDQELVVVANFSSTYTLSVFTTGEFTEWVLNSSTYAMYVQSIKQGTYYIPLPKGNYVVVINHAVNASLSQIELYVDSLNFFSIFSSPRFSVATGIASYGFYNYSGYIYPYHIQTSAILGYFNISSLSTKNGLASLQMNAVLQINGNNNQQLWLQNLILFNIYDNTYSPEDQVWNFSSYLANLSVTGNGKINMDDGRAYYSYIPFWYSNTSYSLPLSGYLITNVSVVQGKGVYVHFGYVIIQSNRLIPPFVNYYDTVFVKCPDVQSAYLLIQPSFTGSLNPYDVELVFGGYYATQDAVFTSLNAKLTLMYYANDKWVDFPSVLSYGLNTQETASNAQTIIRNGQAIVRLGYSEGSFLTNSFSGSIPGFTFINSSGKIFYITSPFALNLTKYKIVDKVINYTLDYILLYINGKQEIVPNYYVIQPNNSWFENITIIPQYSTYVWVTLNYPYGTQSSWYLNGSKIFIPKIINISANIRYLLNSSVDSLLVTSPVNVTLPYVLQYYVDINLPNGSIIGWFNNGSIINFAKIINISPIERYVLNSSSNELLVTSPVNVTLPYVLQYYVDINLPNGSIIGWFNNGSIINIPNLLILNNTKYILNSSSPLIITKSGNYTPYYNVEYLQKIVLPNGTIIEGYFPSGYQIKLPKIIQTSNDTRYILDSADRIIVNASGVIKPAYILQYLVNINGKTQWIEEGEKITVEVFTTPFIIVRWVGNIHIHNGQTITVNEPIYIKAIVMPNTLDYLILLLGIPIAVSLYRRRKL